MKICNLRRKKRNPRGPDLGAKTSKQEEKRDPERIRENLNLAKIKTTRQNARDQNPGQERTNQTVQYARNQRETGLFAKTKIPIAEVSQLRQDLRRDQVAIQGPPNPGIKNLLPKLEAAGRRKKSN